jgi:hypothetical protein
MTPSSGKRDQISPAGQATRKELIRHEMRFVLQRDIRRFTRQLQARLLDEGCNLHPILARATFYEHFERRIASDLPVELRGRFGEDQLQTTSAFTHPRYEKAVKYAMGHLQDAEAKIAAAVLDVIEMLIFKWRQTASQCTIGSMHGNNVLDNLITQLSNLNPDGHLVRHGHMTIRRRLRIAIVTSLLRHLPQPELVRRKFGRVPQILRELGQNPALFPELMTFFKEHVPHAWLVISQTFWRTLTNMDYESPK